MADLERTEQATPKKRQDERQKGNVARSQDVVATIGLVVAIVVLLSSSRSNATSAMNYLRSSLGSGFEVQANAFEFAAAVSGLIFTILKKLAGFFLLVVFAGIVGNLLQTGFLFLPKKAFPDFKRVSPGKNLKRIFSGASALQTLVGLLKMTLFGALAAIVIRRDVQTLATLPFGEPVEIVAFFSRFVSRVAYQFCALSIVVAVADYALRRWKFERDIMMTQQELRDEMKEEAGSPQAKGRRREARRSLMNSVGAINGAAPPFPVSAFRSKSDDKKSEEKKQGKNYFK